MCPKFIRPLLISSILFACLPALAQQDEAEEEIPRYDVEIIVFKNVRVPNSREFVLPASSPGKPETLLDLSSEESIEAAAELGYELLGGEEFRLLDQVIRLIESPRYELLLHTGWRQPGLERGQGMPVWIKGGRVYGDEYTSIDDSIDFYSRMNEELDESGGERVFEFDEQSLEAQAQKLEEETKQSDPAGLYELEGKITIALSRFLHTHTDLVLRRPRLSADPVLSNAATNAYVEANLADTRILNNHHMQEHRRMRSKNLHYIDSPEFGMLILITPYEAPEEPEEDESFTIEEDIGVEPVVESQ